MEAARSKSAAVMTARTNRAEVARVRVRVEEGGRVRTGGGGGHRDRNMPLGLE